jgi:1,4-dihydroxy-2-naphthoate octaprenyltransferase
MMACITRLPAALALTMPMICGVALAWWELGAYNPLTLLFQLCAVLCLTLGMNALNEYSDYKQAIALDAAAESEPQTFGYGLMVHGKIDADVALNLGCILLSVGAICSLWLGLLAGWPALFFAVVSFALAYTYANPPLRYGYWGWGMGELGVFLSYGVLPVLNGYYVQGSTLTWLAAITALPLGLLCLLVCFNYSLVFERRDWLMRKRTLAVSLGPLRALDVSALLAISVYIGIVAIVSLARLPFSVLLTLAGLPVIMGAFGQIQREHLAMEDNYLLYRATIGSTIWMGILFSLALLSDRLF